MFCFFKRCFDFLAGLVAFICLFPVFLIVLLLLFVANNGKPFFLQPRIGKDERIFKIIKFRTMNDRRDTDGKLLPDSERLTPVGAFIRKTSLDEIPQLLNVIKGDMSLIGPRPLLVRYLPFYTEEERIRHTIRPGITGWAQVNGRNNLTWDKRLAADIDYVNNMSVALDLKIIFKTLKNIISSKDIVTLPSNSMMDFDAERNKKNNSRVERLRNLDEGEADEICRLLTSAYPKSILPYVIYSDKNYSRYLRSVVSNYPKEVFFVLRTESMIGGFAHFKIVNGEIFLNNIVISDSNHGIGFGKRLYAEAIEELLQLDEFTTISLDVFGSNLKARSWYKKMGFIERSKTFWYDISSCYPNTTWSTENGLKIESDSNGFSGLYSELEKVASIIDENALVFRSIGALNYLNNIDRNIYKNIALITSEELQFSKLETSYRMSLDLKSKGAVKGVSVNNTNS